MVGLVSGEVSKIIEPLKREFQASTKFYIPMKLNFFNIHILVP